MYRRISTIQRAEFSADVNLHKNGNQMVVRYGNVRAK